jgi:hypothetical protein
MLKNLINKYWSNGAAYKVKSADIKHKIDLLTIG